MKTVEKKTTNLNKLSLRHTAPLMQRLRSWLDFNSSQLFFLLALFSEKMMLSLLQLSEKNKAAEMVAGGDWAGDGLEAPGNF